MEKFCVLCNMVFNLVDYIRHIREVHQGNEHICIICQKSFHRPRDLKGHYGRYHRNIENETIQQAEKTWLCPECGYFGKDVDQQKHLCMTGITDEINFPTFVADKGFSTTEVITIETANSISERELQAAEGSVTTVRSIESSDPENLQNRAKYQVGSEARKIEDILDMPVEYCTEGKL